MIPGEEAPTDPGVHVRQQQEKADRRAAGSTRWIPVLGVGVLFLGVVTAALWVTLHQPPPVAAILDFDDLAGYPSIELVALPVAEDQVPEVATAPKPRPRPRTPAPATGMGDEKGVDASTVDVGQPAVAQVDEIRRVRVGDAPDTELAGGPGTNDVLGGGGPNFDLGGIGVKRAPPRLTTDDAIIGHIYSVMKEGAPRIRKCYDMRLKTTTSVAGTWQIDYTVGREGDVQGVKVVGLEMADADLETCLRREVEQWKFYPIRADQPVTKRFTFRPGF